MSDLRILIVADDPLARAGLAALLADQPGCAVVGQATGSDLPAMLEVYQPDVVLWDVGWEASPTSLNVLRAAMEDMSDIPFIALLPDESVASETWTAGARGLLLRDAPVERLATALAAAVQGLTVIDPGFASTLLPAAHLAPHNARPVEELTPREMEVLQLIAEGLPNKAIAQRLGISEHTVKFHANALMGKLGAQSRTDAVVRATRLGLLIL